MASGTFWQTAGALLDHFSTLTTAPDELPLAYPEIDFDPSVMAPDGKYLQADFFANRHAWEGLTSAYLAQGILQVTVVWPRSQGIVAPAKVAQQVMDHFAKGTVLTGNGIKVTIAGQPWAASPVSEPDSLRIPVSIPWTATAI